MGSDNPFLNVLRLIGRASAVVVVVFWSVLDEVLFRPFRPVVRWLSSLKIFEGIGSVIQRSPPYLVLIMLAVPFVLIEPIKVFALYWIAEGHFVQGTVLLVFAHVLSIFTLDRIYHTGHGQLMKIGWFARLMTWVVGLRDLAFGWVKRTAAWQAAARIASGVRNWFRSLVGSTR
jgi:hypothetical protein